MKCLCPTLQVLERLINLSKTLYFNLLGQIKSLET